MSSLKIHLTKIKEHLEELEDAIRIGIDLRPATIGMHVSLCANELFEAYLHKAGKISAGAMIKHEWFKRPLPGQKAAPIAERKLPISFEKKEEVFDLMYTIEESRNKLIYGKSSKLEIEVCLAAFQKLKDILQTLLEKEGIKIES